MEQPSLLTAQFTEILQAGSYNFPGSCIALTKPTLDALIDAYKAPQAPTGMEYMHAYWQLTGFPVIIADDLADNEYELQETKGGYQTGAGYVPKVVNVIQRGTVFNDWPYVTIQTSNETEAE